MKKVLEFLKENVSIIMIVLSLMMLVKTCGINGNIEVVRDENKRSMDSIRVEHKKDMNAINLTIKITGLEAEKSMIQSTDRKILDVNRQREIDKELYSLKRLK